MTSDYLAVDALIHTRQSLCNTLQWGHDYLAEHYGLEWVAEDEHLPEPLQEVMSVLQHLANEVTDMAVELGAYRRRDDGVLMQPMYYSTHRPVYVQRMAGPVGEQIKVTCLQHPNGQSDPLVGDDRSAGLTIIDGGDGNE